MQRFQPKLDNEISCRKRNLRKMDINIGYSVYYSLKNFMESFRIALKVVIFVLIIFYAVALES